MSTAQLQWQADGFVFLSCRETMGNSSGPAVAAFFPLRSRNTGPWPPPTPGAPAVPRIGGLLHRAEALQVLSELLLPNSWER